MIAQTILQQIGGRRFTAMTGSRDFIDMGNGLRMSLTRNKTSANRLDRDDAGRRTLAALVGRYGERVTDRSFLYDGCKDLNEYLQRTTKKQKNNHLKIEEQ